ncbi:LOW QUALITY PROTEIN: integral membrane protein, partial [Micromonospora sp. M42]
MPSRLVRLFAGLALFGVSVALMVRADLGLASWDVLHQGLAERTGLPMGVLVNGVALLVLLLWIPLRQRPGVGTVANVALVGLALDATLALLPPVAPLAGRIGLLVAGVLLNGLATALYLGARLGPGPRDGLMTGLAARGLPLGPGPHRDRGDCAGRRLAARRRRRPRHPALCDRHRADRRLARSPAHRAGPGRRPDRSDLTMPRL